ncbi:hypothetical protein MSAN_00083300 [Mycena sanguinolenta]|uniref:Uncharacterized protein n=1 Tax=Mycena sanguinolenta TaxID=230812 RepID=A0A8H6ZCT0_9AGAR|nr:hypothetical protein MSAN_00083300 [Mycena sanguinolenta]
MDTDSFYFPARAACLSCPCKGACFMRGENVESKPEVHTDLCVCRHAYTEHCLGRTPDTQNPNYSRIKGGNIPRKCGAFIAPIRPTWQPHTSCVACHEPWYYHDNVEDVPTFPSTASSLPQPPVLNSLPAPPAMNSVPDSSPRRHTGPVLPPPANLFRLTLPTPPAVEFHNPALMGATRFQASLPAPPTVLEQRANSMQRNLPQHTTQRPGASARGARGTHRGRGRGRGGAPVPDNQSTESNPFALIPSTRSVSGSSTTQKKAKSKAAQRNYLVCILPFTHGDHEGL